MTKGFDILSLKGNTPLFHRPNTTNSLQRRALTTAIGADNSRNLTLGNLQGQIVHNSLFINTHINMVGCQNRSHQISLLSKNRKKGAPKKAIIMPTGNSIGAKITRAKVSLKVTIATPNKAAAGNKKR